MRYLLSCLALTLLVWCSCSSMKKQAKAGAGGGNSLAGTGWTLSSIPDFTPEKTRRPVTIIFEDSLSRFGGYAGCNSYGGSYTVEGTGLKLGQVVATKMACMPGLDTENKLYKIFDEVDHFRISGNKLTLMQGEKVLAEFTGGKKEQK
ncbi:META domain-containing protein [Taibaiella koreensis]|uniref:META domain-containing protein n=1 Tax=Taibaiella koreensis TaxID=1268548 RepID=UPI000E599C22|nr:META domain-containing protein [Taibaiella koreensis]